jgi:hypothetical protein
MNQSRGIGESRQLDDDTGGDVGDSRTERSSGRKKKGEKHLAWWVIMNQRDQLLEKGIGTRHPIVQAKRTHLET